MTGLPSSRSSTYSAFTPQSSVVVSSGPAARALIATAVTAVSQKTTVQMLKRRAAPLPRIVGLSSHSEQNSAALSALMSLPLNPQNRR